MMKSKPGTVCVWEGRVSGGRGGEGEVLACKIHVIAQFNCSSVQMIEVQCTCKLQDGCLNHWLAGKICTATYLHKKVKLVSRRNETSARTYQL